MKLFVWNDVDGVSHNYHDGGGVVVIAETLDRAREIIVSEGRSKPDCGALKADPDLVRDCAAGEEYIAIHPDAGCC
jgi:hypothetical protein